MADGDLFGAMPVTHDAGGRSLPIPAGVTASAVYGGVRDCYRHRLDWMWRSGPTLMCLGMNPSVAGHLCGDTTICKLHVMASRRGFGRLLMGNVHGYRATDQMRLAEVVDPIGPSNLRQILDMASEADEIWVIYGRPKIKALQANGPALARKLRDHGHVMHALRVSTDGNPWHPLLLPYATEPFRWEAPHD